MRDDYQIGKFGMKHLDDMNYVKFCNRQNLNKSLTTLQGIISGVTMDGKLVDREIRELKNWCLENSSFAKLSPFNEIIPMVYGFLDDGTFDESEIHDLKWFLRQAVEDNPYYDCVTADIQYLQGLLHGIISDGTVSQAEIESLSKWLQENEELSGCYPYDEIYSIVTDVLADGKVDEKEAEFLKAYFSEYSALSLGNQFTINKELKARVTALGVCAVAPDIEFKGMTFCFTGLSPRAKRSEFAELVLKMGGNYSDNITNSVDFLIYGAAGNRCWAYSCYGRKVEMAVELRKRGKRILIVHESDFWDCYEDLK